MALSAYSNWGSSMDHSPFMPDMGFPPNSPNHHQQKHERYVDDQFDLPINFDDPLLEAINDVLSVDADNVNRAASLLIDGGEEDQFLQFQSFSDPSVLSLPQDLSRMPDPFEDIIFYPQQPQPKRARSFNDFDLSTNQSSHFTVDPFFSSSVFPQVEYTPHPQFMLPQMPAMEFCVGRGSYVNGGNNNNNSGGKPSNGCLSAQSAAARERRKRISDKTQELGKLIPGGHKMNTAEMFQSAAKYVKFLQAQIGILALLPHYRHNHPESSSSDEEEEEERKHQEQLLTSTAVQEKLYRAERCISPKRMVDDLINDTAVKSHPFISRDLIKFVESMKDHHQTSSLTTKIS